MCHKHHNGLDPEQRRRWEMIIERDLRDIAEGKPQKYIMGDEFWGKPTAAVMRQYKTVQAPPNRANFHNNN